MSEDNKKETKPEVEDTYKEVEILEKDKKTAPKKGKKPLTEKQRANLEAGRKKRHEMMKNPRNIEKPKKAQNPRPKAEMDSSSEESSSEEEYTPPPKPVRRSKRQSSRRGTHVIEKHYYYNQPEPKEKKEIKEETKPSTKPTTPPPPSPKPQQKIIFR